jgi:hypothetical protein
MVAVFATSSVLVVRKERVTNAFENSTIQLFQNIDLI